MAMSTARMPVQNKLAWGRSRAKGKAPEDREPYHGDASHAVTDCSSSKGADHDAGEEGEQVELCRLHGQVELVDQIERVVRAEARAVHVLGEEQGHENSHRFDDLPARQRVLARGRDGHHGGGPGARARSGGGAMARVPATDEQEHEDGDERRHREPRNARLSVWHHDKCGEQWAGGRADVPADLEEGLGEPVASAGRHAGHAGCFGMEDRRAHADQHGGEEDRGIRRGAGHQEETDEGEADARGQGIRLRVTVGIEADHGLQHGGRALKGQGDETHLAEGQAVGVLEDGIERGHQRLHHVVEQMAEAQRQDDREGGADGWCRRP